MRDAIRQAFPAVDDIADDSLRERTIDAWTLALTETGVEDLAAVPWYPPEQKRLGIPDALLVEHVRDVAATAAAMARTLRERRGADIDADLVLAGALLHDVSKLYEFDGMEATPIGEHVGHPLYGLYVVGRAGLGPEVANVVVSHTPRTNVEPSTLEAEIVRRADEAAAAAIRAGAGADPRA